MTKSNLTARNSSAQPVYQFEIPPKSGPYMGPTQKHIRRHLNIFPDHHKSPNRKCMKNFQSYFYRLNGDKSFLFHIHLYNDYQIPNSQFYQNSATRWFGFERPIEQVFCLMSRDVHGFVIFPSPFKAA